MSVLVCLAHQLTEAQSKELGNQVSLLKEIEPDLFQKLIQCPSDRKELQELAEKLYDVAFRFKTIVLPIGSPAFMWEFATYCSNGREAYSRSSINAIFAHSERKSVDVPQEDGTVKKNTVFEHQFFF